MSIIVFTGPTINKTVAKQIFNAEYRPPAKLGDVYSACLSNPRIIAIIDGYFANEPAVWHKEILYAMSQGIHVYGCSSMGALRAAELSLFGMEGFGTVYQMFEQGILEDDDEVAITHAPQEFGFQNLSDAMVNIRATFESAQKHGIINESQTKKLHDIAKQMWYPKRRLQAVVANAGDVLTIAQKHQLEAFISANQVDLKLEDAITLLRHLSDIDLSTLKAKQVDYRFAHTDAWQQLIDQVETQQLSNELRVDIGQFKQELKVANRFDEINNKSIARQLKLDAAHTCHIKPLETEFRDTLIRFAQSQNLVDNGQINFAKVTQWLELRQMDMADFDDLMRKQANIEKLAATFTVKEQTLLDLLRLDSSFDTLQKRIRDKEQITAQLVASDGPAAQQKALRDLPDTDTLWQWYFDKYWQSPVPDDLAGFALSIGLESQAALHQEVIVEYIYHSGSSAE